MMARFSPILGVTKPSTRRPTVMPSQKPVAAIPLANGSPLRTWIMNSTIQPPSETSTPTYPSRKTAHSHVTRAAGIRSTVSRRFPLAESVVFANESRYCWPLNFQKHDVTTMSSTAASPTFNPEKRGQVSANAFLNCIRATSPLAIRGLCSP